MVLSVIVSQGRCPIGRVRLVGPVHVWRGVGPQRGRDSRTGPEVLRKDLERSVVGRYNALVMIGGSFITITVIVFRHG